MIQSVDELFECCGGPARVGRAIGIPTEHAASMKRRGSIPSDYWVRLVEWADSVGLATDVTFESLARIHAKPAPAQPDPQPAGVNQ